MYVHCAKLYVESYVRMSALYVLVLYACLCVLSMCCEVCTRVHPHVVNTSPMKVISTLVEHKFSANLDPVAKPHIACVFTLTLA